MNKQRRNSVLNAYLTNLWSKYGKISVLFVVSVLVVALTGVFSITRGGANAVTTSNLNFQARLLQTSGSLVADGTYNVQFNLYTVASGGSTQWTETYLNTTTPVTIKDGYMSVSLGSLTAFPGTIDWDQEQWLGMTVRGTGSCAFGACTPTDGEMTPRFKITAVPYAFKSAVSANVQSAATNTVSTNSSGVSVVSGNAAGATSNSGSITIDSGTATGTTGALLFGTTNASALTLGRTGVTTTLQGSVSLTGAGTALAVTNDATIGGTLAVTGTSTFTGLLTANGGVTVATGNTFTNASSTLFTALSISNVAGGGAIGTAAATVDVATTFNVNQTTASQTLSLPTPTVTTAGRIAFVNNIGSTSFTMHGSVVNNGGASSFIWNGTTWVTNLSLNSSVVTGIGVIDSQTKSANGAVVASNQIVLQTADATNVGLVSIGTQTFAGAKTFNTAASFTSAGTGLAVTNDATIGGTLAVTSTSTFTGLGTFNGGLTVATGNTFTNASSTLLTAQAVSDLPTGGNIGTAATTVDVATTFNVNQTTASQTLILPTPTNNASGRIVYINNIGSTSFIMHGATVANGGSNAYIWNGSAWVTSVSLSSSVVSSIGAIDTQTKSANGGVIVANALYLQTADASNVGLVSIGAQTFAGAKTFNSAIAAPTTIDTINGLIINAGALNGVTGITTTGGYTQTGASANTFTGATTVSGVLNATAAGTGLAVTNNATIGGNLTVDTSTLYVDSTNNQVSIGTTSNIGAKFAIVGTADQEQLLVRANSTQSASNPLIVAQDSSGTELFRLSARDQYSIYLGFNAGAVDNGAGNQNVGIGSSALWKNTSGYYNVAIGSQALYESIDGTSSIAVGQSALSLSSSGDQNVAIGGSALGALTTTNYNTAVGYNAGLLTTGTGNVLYGYKAGDNLTTGDYNIIIGYDLDASAAGVSNELRIGGVIQGNTSTLAAQFNGALTVVGNVTANANLTVGSGAGVGLFTNNGATLNTTLAVADDANGGPLGAGLAASASVDVYTAININQTTASQTITLPSPTSATAGRVLYISNVGSASFIISGTTIATGSTSTLVWNGTAWSFAGAGGSGVTTIGAVSGTPTANGGTITGTTLNLAVADASNAGLISTGAQTIGGAKTFSALLTANLGLTVSGAITNINDSSNFDTNINTGTSTGAVNIGNSAAGTITIQSAGTIALNAGTLSTTSTTVNVLNTTATTVNAFGAGTAITVGAATGTLTLNNPTIVSGATTLTLFNTTTTTANVLGAATSISLGAATGTLTINNATTQVKDLTTSNTTASLFNTTATTVNAFGASTNTTIGATTGSLTVRNANQTFGNAAGSGLFTNNGATVNTTLVVGNDTDGGALGGTPGSPLSAAASVDVYTSISVAQTTGSMNITLPSPTASTAYGRVLYLSNVGNVSFTLGVAAVTVNPGTTATLVWSNTNGGASWQFAGADGNGILNQNSSDQTANFRITGTGRANTSLTTPLVDSITGALSIGTTTATGVTIGNAGNNSGITIDSGTGTIAIGTGAQARTTNIATGAAVQTVSLGSTNSTSSLTLQAGTGALNIQTQGTGGINIGTNAVAQVVTLGNSTGASQVVLNAGTAGVNVGTNGIANTIQIGNTTGAVTQAINIGTNATGSSTNNVTIGSTIGGSLTLQNSATINLNAGTIVGNATTQNLFNTVATTLNVGGAATTVTLGATSGTLTVRNANQTFGNAAGSGLFTNNGATLNTTLAVADDANGGPLGAGLTAAASVDVYTAISINQTTASQTITLPSPTSTTIGRVLYVSNVGSTSFTLLGITVSNGTTATLFWNGTAWTFAGADGNGILNQNATDQTANFRISGTGRANTSFTTPLVDSITGALSIGTTTATGVTIGGTTNTTALTIQGAVGAAYTIGSNATTGTIAIGGTAQTGALTLGSSSGTNSVLIGNGAGATTVNISNANTAGAVNIGAAFTTGTITIGGTGAQTGTISIGTGTGAQALNFGTGGTAAKTVTVGSQALASSVTIDAGTGAISIGTSASARTTNIATGAAAQTVTIGSTNTTSATTIAAGSGAITFNAAQAQFSEVTGTRTLTVQTRTTNVAGTALTVSAGTAGSGATAFAGGLLTLQGGAAAGTTGNVNGGDVTITGGSGQGATGYQGLVNLSSSAFTSAAVQTIGTTGVQAITAGNQNIYSTLPITASVTGVIATIGDPGQSIIGRILYITARSGSNDFTLRLNSTRTPIDIAMKANSTATLIWNGTDWTAAGASSSTDLQSAYNNTLTGAGGAELVLNASGGAADGLTVRNNATTPIIGGIFEAQTSVGSNIFSVNNNAAEFAVNGGAETSTNFATNWTSAPAGGTVARNTSTPADTVATGQASVSVVTTTTLNHGAEAVLSAALTPNLKYNVSYTVRSSAVTGSFTALETMFSSDGTATAGNVRACVAGTPTYFTGTASQSTTTITGSGTTWTAGMVGQIFVFSNGASALITGFGSATSLTTSAAYSQTVTSRTYNMYNAGNTVKSGAWSRVSCTFTAPASGMSAANSVFIRQSDALAKTFYIDNLSVTVSADVNHAIDGSVDDVTNFATNWTQIGGATVARNTSVIYDTGASASATTTATIGHGIRNNLGINPAISTQYLVTFYARSTNTFNDIRVRYTRDGGTNFVSCGDYNTQSISTTGFTRVTCLLTTDGTTPSNADLVIDQPTATARTFYIDALSMTLNTNNSNNVQVGAGAKGGPVTLFTLDRAASSPIAANNDAYLGSMYYDTTSGRIQCYEADGWGACGSAPDNYVNLNPEYAGAVLNGSGVGTMTADFCANQSGVLQVNISLCATGESRNFYKWTSPQSSPQTYSIYVSYQLPATFKGFASDDTVQLTARTNNTTDGIVSYEMFKSESGALTACGTSTTVTSIVDTWQTVGINGNESTSCSFTNSSANAFVIFKINVTADSNANVYVGTLSFTTTGR